MDKQALLDYYSNLLIIQYHDKPNAVADVGVKVNNATADFLITDLLDLLDVDTAIGAQLDLIGKIVGIDRSYISTEITGNQFNYLPYDTDEADVPDDYGFSTYITFDSIIANWIKYKDFLGTNRQLNDADYRYLIKLKIVKNYAKMTHKAVDDMLFSFFGNDVVADTRDDMTMNYFISSDLTTIMQAAISKNVLPKPLGVGIDYFISQENDFFGYCTYANENPNCQGFSTYADFDTKAGDFLTYDELIGA